MAILCAFLQLEIRIPADLWVYYSRGVQMKTKTLALLASVASIAAASIAHADTNVALGASVTVVSMPSYDSYNNGTAGNLGKITDGTLLPEGTGYNSSTAINNAVEWNGKDTVFQINLGASYTINSLLVQADDNDAYYLQYLNLQTNTWTALYTAPIMSEGVGIVTRPSEYDPTAIYTLPTSVTTDAVRIFGGNSYDNACINNICGQGGYALAQVELFGNPAPVPLPASAWMLLGGLGGLGVLTRKKLAA